MTNPTLIPFDLIAAKAGAKVQTRDGRKARIVCFDRDDPCYKIVALAYNPRSGCEETGNYAINGREDAREGMESIDDLFMAAPEIPEGWTKYDPDVPPPEDALELAMMYEDAPGTITQLVSDWLINGTWKNKERNQDRKCYRITKWKIPEGYIRHDGGPCPVDPETIAGVFVSDSDKIHSRWTYEYIGEASEPLAHAQGCWEHAQGHVWIEAYKLKPQKPTLDNAIQALMDARGMYDEMKTALRQFADAIKNEIKDNK